MRTARIVALAIAFALTTGCDSQAEADCEAEGENIEWSFEPGAQACQDIAENCLDACINPRDDGRTAEHCYAVEEFYECAGIVLGATGVVQQHPGLLETAVANELEGGIPCWHMIEGMNAFRYEDEE